MKKGFSHFEMDVSDGIIKKQQFLITISFISVIKTVCYSSLKKGAKKLHIHCYELKNLSKPTTN